MSIYHTNQAQMEKEDPVPTGLSRRGVDTKVSEADVAAVLDVVDRRQYRVEVQGESDDQSADELADIMKQLSVSGEKMLERRARLAEGQRVTGDMGVDPKPGVTNTSTKSLNLATVAKKPKTAVTTTATVADLKDEKKDVKGMPSKATAAAAAAAVVVDPKDEKVDTKGSAIAPSSKELARLKALKEKMDARNKELAEQKAAHARLLAAKLKEEATPIDQRKPVALLEDGQPAHVNSTTVSNIHPEAVERVNKLQAEVLEKYKAELGISGAAPTLEPLPEISSDQKTVVDQLPEAARNKWHHDRQKKHDIEQTEKMEAYARKLVEAQDKAIKYVNANDISAITAKQDAKHNAITALERQYIDYIHHMYTLCISNSFEFAKALERVYTALTVIQSPYIEDRTVESPGTMAFHDMLDKQSFEKRQIREQILVGEGDAKMIAHLKSIWERFAVLVVDPKWRAKAMPGAALHVAFHTVFSNSRAGFIVTLVGYLSNNGTPEDAKDYNKVVRTTNLPPVDKSFSWKDLKMCQMANGKLGILGANVLSDHMEEAEKAPINAPPPAKGTTGEGVMSMLIQMQAQLKFLSQSSSYLHYMVENEMLHVRPYLIQFGIVNTSSTIKAFETLTLDRNRSSTRSVSIKLWGEDGVLDTDRVRADVKREIESQCRMCAVEKQAYKPLATYMCYGAASKNNVNGQVFMQLKFSFIHVMPINKNEGLTPNTLDHVTLNPKLVSLQAQSTLVSQSAQLKLAMSQALTPAPATGAASASMVKD